MCHAGVFPYAIKFFLKRKDFEDEVRMYRDPALRDTLPTILHATANEDGALRSRSGYTLPPFVVLERCATAWSYPTHSACRCLHQAREGGVLQKRHCLFH